MALDYDIKIFSMGGTIDKTVYSYDALDYVVGEPQILKIIEASNVSVRISCESLAKKDSLELTSDDRDMLHQKIKDEPCPRIIITHGTDTISETAKTLTGIADKTIVLTGAMLPARFIDSDAAFNVGGAIIAAQTLPAGLYLVMHGKVFDPTDIVKDRTKSLFLENAD